MSLFVNVKLNYNTIDRYYIRNSIFKSIEHNINLFNGKLLDIGCGQMPYRHYLINNSSICNYHGLDIENALLYDPNIKPDYTWDGLTMPFDNEQYDCVFGTEVLEHCPDPKIILSETYRVLKPGAPFFFTVPFLWPLHEVPHDEYRYTPFALKRILEECGYKNIQLTALGGWNASLAQMLGLWLKRSKMSKSKRIFHYLIVYPIYLYLIKTDRLPKEFHESTMITGIAGIAYK
jgi:SAM-dependent methyltransferase